MYQLIVAAIPPCRVRDKGTLIQVLTKIGQENILLYAGFEELFESQLLFVTAQGLLKQVSGAECETNRSIVNTTKCDDGYPLVGITVMHAHDIFSGNMKVVLMTEKKLSLGFPLEEVPEMKKTS